MSYSEFMNETVMPFINDRRTVRPVTARDGKELYCECFRADTPCGTVYILHGFTEHIVKYSEMIYNFLVNSLSVCIYEQRGHGRSFRQVADKTLTHIERFEQYMEDFEDMLGATEDMIRPYYLFAHSMGGAVAAMYLEKGGDVFEKAVLSSPMIAPVRGGMPLFLPKLICRAAILLGKKKKRIYVAKPYPGKEEFENSCSSYEERFAYYEKIKRETEDFHNYSPTYAWLLEALKVTKKILAKDAPKRIKIPVLIIAAGIDNAVLPEPQIQFASEAENCERCVIPEAKHEIYLSDDETVSNYCTMICNFFAQ